MEITDTLKKIGSRVTQLSAQINTEEATKNAVVMPFLQALGYDVFNPLEVVPEYVTDIGTKKGEKIDYAIFRNGKPIILIECKHLKQNLDIHDGQLLRYFHVSKAKFAILTNGKIFRFYSDLERENIMDKQPFLEFDITDLKENKIEEIKKFHRSNFNIDTILSSASDLKYLNALKKVISDEFESPSEALIKLLTKKIYEGKISSRVLEQFSILTKKAMDSFVSERVSSRLKLALADEDETHSEIEQPVEEDSKVITTEEELEGFAIVKAIVRKDVEINRIHYRDAQSYFAILLDDNNRKSICRLHLNSKNLCIITFDDQKNSIKHEIDKIDDIYNFADEIRLSLSHLL